MSQPATLCGADSDPQPQAQQAGPSAAARPRQQQQQQLPDASAPSARDQGCGRAPVADAPHDCCGVSRSSMDSSSSFLSCCTEDSGRRGTGTAGVLRRASACSAISGGSLASGGGGGRRVRFSEAAAPPSAAAAVAAAAARPAAGGALIQTCSGRVGGGAPRPPSPFALPQPCSPEPATTPGAGAADPFAQLAALRGPSSPSVAGMPQAHTRRYQRGRFAVQEGVLLLETFSGGASLAAGACSPQQGPPGSCLGQQQQQQARGSGIPRTVSLPDTNSLGLQASAAGAAAAAAAAGSFGALCARPAAAGSCSELPTLAEEDGPLCCGAGSDGCGGSDASGSSDGGGLGAAAPRSTPARRPRATDGGAAACLLARGCASASQLLTHSADARPRGASISYFRRGRFMVSSTVTR